MNILCDSLWRVLKIHVKLKHVTKFNERHISNSYLLVTINEEDEVQSTGVISTFNIHFKNPMTKHFVEN